MNEKHQHRFQVGGVEVGCWGCWLVGFLQEITILGSAGIYRICNLDSMCIQ